MEVLKEEVNFFNNNVEPQDLNFMCKLIDAFLASGAVKASDCTVVGLFYNKIDRIYKKQLEQKKYVEEKYGDEIKELKEEMTKILEEDKELENKENQERVNVIYKNLIEITSKGVTEYLQEQKGQNDSTSEKLESIAEDTTEDTTEDTEKLEV